MLTGLKSMFELMGQGLAHQHHGELSPTADKLDQIEQRCSQYAQSGGRGRIVLIASNDLMWNAFDFVVELADKTNSLIEVLYYKPQKGAATPLNSLMEKLAALTCDFQVTFANDDLYTAIANYHHQRQDVMAVVSSASETFVKDLASHRNTVDAVSKDIPDILVIGDSLAA